MKGQLLEGFRYVAHEPLLRDSLIMMGLVGMVAYEFQVTLPLMAKHTFAGGAALYGLLNSSQGAGAIVGGLIAAGRPGRGPRRLVNTSLAFGVFILLAALAPNPATEVIALLFVGAASVTFLSLGNSTPPTGGRAVHAWPGHVAVVGGLPGLHPIGGPLVGVIGGALGARYGLGAGSAACLGAAAVGYLTLVRRRRGMHPAPTVRADLLAASAATVVDRADPGSPRADGSQRLPSASGPA